MLLAKEKHDAIEYGTGQEASRVRKAPRASETRSRFVVGYLIVLGMTVALALAYVAMHTSIVMARQHVSDLETQIMTLQKERDEIEVRIAELSSVDRVERVARERLHMEDGGARVLVATLPPDDGPAPEPPTRTASLRQKGGETVLAKVTRWIASIGYAQASTGEE